MINLAKSIEKLSKRGPDSRGSYVSDRVALGHRRLSIIDTSYQGNQPMTVANERYHIVFNGEIFNYKALRQELLNKGYSFNSDTDTEVLLKLYIDKKEACLNDLIGFFAFAIFDKEENSVFLARDRFGIKPLLYYVDEDKFIFASEMKALLSYNIPKDIDEVSIFQYLQYNYTVSPHTIYRNVKKLEEGHYILVKDKQVKKKSYYSIPSANNSLAAYDYESKKKELITLLDEAVEIRLNADVPVGAFLSGGIDSSVIVALASRHVSNLNTFSIGFKDEPFFDETKYAEIVSKKFNTNHTVFSLTNNDLLSDLFEMLDYMDEPFGDSSCLPFYILSKRTSGQVKVALSGDGADEIFGGYNKHKAEYQILNNTALTSLMKVFDPVYQLLPKSRNGLLGDKVRQLLRYSEGSKMSPRERYSRWCGFLGEKDAQTFMSGSIDQVEYESRKNQSLRLFKNYNGLDTVLRTDMEQVLVNDMLYKVDLMSSSNGLEIRVPFLDHRIVNFAFDLPSNFKIDNSQRKKILKDAFQEILPSEIYKRSKKGFEVPLLNWLKTDLKALIETNLFSQNFIEEQNIFSYPEIQKLLKMLNSKDPVDAPGRVWGLLVFQYWYKKYHN